VTNISAHAFDNCAFLKKIIIPEGVKTIGDYAFYCAGAATASGMGDDALKEIIIPNSVTSIGAHAFGDCATTLEEMTIPAGVTSIGYGAFKGIKNISLEGNGTPNYPYILEDGILFDNNKTEILFYSPENKTSEYAIPDGVKVIGDGAFYHCRYLEKVTIPTSVETIGDYAFDYCYGNVSSGVYNGLKNVVFSEPSSLKTIGKRAFARSMLLREIDIPDSVTAIGERAFEQLSSYSDNTGLLHITLPKNLKKIEASTFYNCNKLESIEIPKGVTSIGERAFSNCRSLKEVTIPDGVVSIERGAFGGCEALEKVTIPGSLKTLGSGAFYSSSSSLKELIFTNGLTSIGYNTSFANREFFYNCCPNLEKLTIPDTVKEINTSAFSQLSNFKEIIVGSDNTIYSSENGILYNKDKTKLIYCPKKFAGEKIVIPNSVTSIENGAFSGCANLTEITIPGGIGNVESVISNCDKLSLIYCEKGSSAEKYAMDNNITFKYFYPAVGGNIYYENDTVTRSDEGVTSVVIPASIGDIKLTKIGDNAFKNCMMLNEIRIPANITEIGTDAFVNCTKLTTIHCEKDSAAYTYAKGEGKTCKLFHPTSDDKSNSYEIYYDENGVISGFGGNTGAVSTLEIPDSIKDVPITAVSDEGFGAFENMEIVLIPKGITNIGSDAFKKCAKLQYINVRESNSVYSTVNGVLYNKAKTELICCPVNFDEESYTIPEGVTTINDYAFSGCKKLKEIIIPKSVGEIGNYAFEGCGGLEKITIPSGIKNIKNGVFSKCSGLKDITIPGGVEIVGNEAFADCDGLSVIIIPSGVVGIGDGAFKDCDGLTRVIIMENEENNGRMIGDNAFRDCDNLEKIVIPRSISSIGTSAFDNCRKLTIYCYDGSVAQKYAVQWLIESKTVAPGEEFTSGSAIVINKEMIEINEGNKIQLTADISLGEIEEGNREVSWSSDKPEIVSIDENGLILGVSEGKAVITASLENGKEAKLSVVVKKADNSGTGDSGSGTGEHKPGDVDGDGVLTARDAAMILQKVLNENFIFPIDE